MPLKGIKIESELHRRLRQAAADRDTTIQQIMERGAELALAEFSDSAAKTPPNEKEASLIGNEESAHVATFLRMLRSGDDRTRRIVLLAIEPWANDTSKRKTA